MVEWAKNELKLIGLTDKVDEEDLDSRMDAHMYRHLIHMVEEFCKEGHSGFSANYAANILEKLFKYEPLSPLSGKDDEWEDVSEITNNKGYFQNKRCGRVMKQNDGKAYDSSGIVWWDWYVVNPETGEKSKSYFTNYKSRVDIEFPYVPKTEYKEWVEENEN